MAKTTPQLLTSAQKLRMKQALPIVGLVAVVGSVVVWTIFAAGAPIGFEAESGTLANGATTVSTTGASAGSAVKFGSAATPSPSATPSTGARGWAKIANGTLVSDQNTLLRGATLWYIPGAGSQFSWATSTSPWAYFTQYHLNVVRLAIEYGPSTCDAPPPLSLTAAESDIDAAITQANTHHMYVVIDLHCASGRHDQPSAITFWTAIAARYKTDTNVIYELLNEPVSWNPTDYTTQDLADEQQLYGIVRAAAPSTPIIMMTFPIPANSNSNPSPTMLDVTNKLTGIDWSNTVVGFHGYWVNNDAGELQLKTKYAVMNTEMHEPLSGTSGEYETVNSDTEYAQAMEKDGMSWICWNCDDTQGDTSNLSGLQSDAVAKGYWWPADQ